MLREEAQCLPTPQELNMQTKMVTNIIKIKKLIATDNVAMEMKKFFRFLSRENKEFSKTVAEKYMDYKGLNVQETFADTPLDTAPDSQHAGTPTTENSVMPIPAHDELPTTAMEVSDDMLTPLPAEVEHLSGQAPPFTRADFDEYKYQLYNYETGDAESVIQFNDKRVNKRWFEYNLLQYTLPVNRRQFLQDESRYPKQINHTDTERHIRHYLSKLQSAAPKKENAA